VLGVEGVGCGVEGVVAAGKVQEANWPRTVVMSPRNESSTCFTTHCHPHTTVIYQSWFSNVRYSHLHVIYEYVVPWSVIYECVVPWSVIYGLGVGVRVWFRVQVSGFRFRVWGSGFRL